MEKLKVKLTLRFPDDLWLQFKSRCALMGKGLQERVQELVKQDIENGKDKTK